MWVKPKCSSNPSPKKPAVVEPGQQLHMETAVFHARHYQRSSSVGVLQGRPLGFMTSNCSGLSLGPLTAHSCLCSAEPRPCAEI